MKLPIGEAVWGMANATLSVVGMLNPDFEAALGEEDDDEEDEEEYEEPGIGEKIVNGIGTGNGFVIHYAAKKGDFGKNVCVQKTPFKRFRKKSPCYVCRLPESFTGTHKVFSPEETLERAKSRLGEASYSLFSNNCEHFVLWCKTGYAESEQAERLRRTLSAIPLIGKGTAFVSQPELRDEIREILINGIFDFFDTVTNGLYELSEKIGRLDFSGTSR